MYISFLWWFQNCSLAKLIFYGWYKHSLIHSLQSWIIFNLFNQTFVHSSIYPFTHSFIPIYNIYSTPKMDESFKCQGIRRKTFDTANDFALCDDTATHLIHSSKQLACWCPSSYPSLHPLSHQSSNHPSIRHRRRRWCRRCFRCCSLSWVGTWHHIFHRVMTSGPRPVWQHCQWGDRDWPKRLGGFLAVA